MLRNEFKNELTIVFKKFLESNSEFIVPENITDNQHKLIYKIGYLKKMYERVYPKDSNKTHFKKMSVRWNIFKSVRQMERLNNQYNDLKEKGEI